MATSRFGRSLVLGSSAVLVGVLALAASAGVANAADEVVGPGYTREHRVGRLRLSASQLKALMASNKEAQIDPATGEILLRTFTDHLPKNWLLERPKHVPDDARIDSFGEPIVNETPGLPAWSQRDVDGLREAISQWRSRLLISRIDGRDIAETEGILGNYIGQAISRQIMIDDLLLLEDRTMVTQGVASSILNYLHYYENLRFENQTTFSYRYAPTEYPARISHFATTWGTSLDRIQTVVQAATRTDRGGQPSGCYARTTLARGMTLLSTPTVIWSANGFDDEQADVPTGFPVFRFFSCQDRDNNDSVRVSTNGYISFFQQGGGATAGTILSNDLIPATDDPDGFAAPWWDDLIVATSQGNTDSVRYKTEGAVDSRVFTVEWFSISRLGGLATDFHFFQVKLFETTDIVELHISADWSSDSVDAATCGIENYSGAGGDCGPNCLNSNAVPPANNYRFTPSPRPTNDACAQATEAFSGSVVQGSLINATADGVATCGSSTGNRDVWYSFVAQCTGTLKVTSCGSRNLGGTEAGVDTVLSAYSSCPGTTINQLACSDDAVAAGCASNDSEISVQMAVGQQVFVRVTHFGDLAFRLASGDFVVRFDLIPTTPVSNDSCASALPLVEGGTGIASLKCASNDGASSCGSSETNPDLWYSFTAPRSGLLRVRACGSRNNAGTDTGPDTVISIHSDCPPSPGQIGNELACNDDGFVAGCSNIDADVRTVVLAGQSVRIRVTHFGSSLFRFGNGLTIVNTTLLPCPSDFNASGQVTVQDVFDFLTAWFNGSASADFNGQGGITVQDIFDFLTAWFTGC